MKKLADALLLTAKTREESDSRTQINEFTSHYSNYKLSISEAAEATCPAGYAPIVTMLLHNSWNEALDWARDAQLAQVETDIELRNTVFQALGQVSMCWDPLPNRQVFQSTRAQEIGDRLMEEIKAAYDA